jgi:hypothetical protein
MIHVIKLRKVLDVTVRINEEFEGEIEPMTPEEAVESAHEIADDAVFLSWEDAAGLDVEERMWETTGQEVENPPAKEDS